MKRMGVWGGADFEVIASYTHWVGVLFEIYGEHMIVAVVAEHNYVKGARNRRWPGKVRRCVIAQLFNLRGDNIAVGLVVLLFAVKRRV